MAAGCSVVDAPPSPSASSATGASGDPAAGLPYACASDPFDIRVFSMPPTAETSNDPAVDGLRKTLVTDPSLPPAGWWLIGRSVNQAQFAARGGESLWYVRVELREGAWNTHSWGDCSPRLQIDGLSTALWALDPDAPPIGPETMVIRAVVTEHCVPEPLAGRLETPIVRATGDVVLVAFTARPPVGLNVRIPQQRPTIISTASRELHDICLGHSSATIDVELGEPLGHRLLVDGATWPARDARQPLEP